MNNEKIQDIEEFDIRSVRIHILEMSLKELGDLLGVTPTYVALVEKMPNPPKHIIQKLQLIILERRIQILERIVSSSNLNNKLLTFFEKNR